DRAHMGFEHEVELAGLGKFAAAVRTDDAALGVALHLAVAAFLELVGTPPEVAALTVDERVAEAGHVATGHPDLGVGDEGGVEADDIVALADHGAPPGLPDVPLQFDSKRAVVVGVREAAM